MDYATYAQREAIWHPLKFIAGTGSPLEARPLRRSARIKSKPKSPSKPLTLCTPCQKGPFAAQLGLFHPPLELHPNETYDHGGYTYTVIMSQMRRRASTGCAWCTLLLGQITSQHNATRRKGQPAPPSRFEIALGFEPSEGYTPVETQKFRVCMNPGKRLFDVILQTSKGASARYTWQPIYL